MIKKLLLPIFTFFIFSLFSSTVLAADFKLTHIGTLETEGKVYSQWNYSGTQPTLKGTGTVGASVEVKIDETVNSVVVDAEEVWSFTPAEALSEGAHQVVLTSGEEVINFTLTISEATATATSTATTSGDSLPVAGNISYTLMILILGGITFLLGGIFFFKPQSLFLRK